MKSIADIAVRSPDDQTKLVVEIILKREVSRDWAIKLRDHSKITSHFSEDAEYSFAWVEYRVDGGKVPPSVGRKL